MGGQGAKNGQTGAGTSSRGHARRGGGKAVATAKEEESSRSEPLRLSCQLHHPLVHTTSFLCPRAVSRPLTPFVANHTSGHDITERAPGKSTQNDDESTCRSQKSREPQSRVPLTISIRLDRLLYQARLCLKESRLQGRKSRSKQEARLVRLIRAPRIRHAPAEALGQ